MLRRHFLNNFSLGTSSLMIPNLAKEFISPNQSSYKFNLKYAPHFGMFKNSAGDNLIDQLNYIADQGFTAFEDNNLKKRTIDTQNKMSKTMQKRGIEMGVFVAQKGSRHGQFWGGPNSTRISP